MNKNSGFTLIELVVVIVILAILAVIAIPRYIDLTTEARNATINGVAGGLSSSNAINYAARKANSAKGVSVANCTDVANTLQSGIPSGYTITSGAVSVDSSITCTVNGPGSTTSTFIATGIS